LAIGLFKRKFAFIYNNLVRSTIIHYWQNLKNNFWRTDLERLVMSNDSISTLPAVWLAEGQSSQRDMLQSLQALKAKSTLKFTIIASHRHNRPEIFEFADKVFIEPKDNDKNALPRWQFVLNHAREITSKCC